jgi:hypothetical protein
VFFFFSHIYFSPLPGISGLPSRDHQPELTLLSFRGKPAVGCRAIQYVAAMNVSKLATGKKAAKAKARVTTKDKEICRKEGGVLCHCFFF